MQVPADGLVVEGFSLQVNQSSRTGDSTLLRKEAFSRLDEKADPFLLAGSKVEEGTGTMLVCAVGSFTDMQPEEDEDETFTSQTPLQQKLAAIADTIGKFGFFLSLAIFLILMTYLCVKSIEDGEWYTENSRQVIHNFLLFVTIIVVAVPEGLPLAVTLSLAYSLGTMSQEQILVRRLQACEAMGSVTDICTDKTGILTTNRMSVVAVYLLGEVEEKTDEKYLEVNDYSLKQLLVRSFALNSDASIIVHPRKDTELKGNRTECAMLNLANRWHEAGYEDIRTRAQILARVPFSPSLRWMSTVASEEGQVTVYTKGAPEAVLSACTKLYQVDNTSKPLTDEDKLWINKNVTAQFARKGLRPVALAIKQGLFDETDFMLKSAPNRDFLTSDLTLLGILGIQDPVRWDVPEAVAAVQKSGINIRMVTGDNVETAVNVAKKCGILPKTFERYPGGFAVMEGEEFERKIGELKEVNTPSGGKITKVPDLYQFTNIANELKVLARATPKQKHILVTGLREMENKIVAVTGESSSDTMALRKAHVGFAMNVAGTQLARDAADIVLLDDNFASIVTALKWGRNIYDAVRKFIQFQLTVNVVTLTVCLIGALATNRTPLTAVQMLWINLIMDTFAALALATEGPTKDLIFGRPIKRTESLLNDDMKRTILCATLYQLLCLLLLLFAAPALLGITPTWQSSPLWVESEHLHFTLFFNTFVYLQLFNELNCRKLKSTEKNVFAGLCSNKLFWVVLCMTALVQVGIVQLGG
jgi:magnesium-transporting ATPase (P-type)